MGTTVTIDDALYEKALEVADPSMEKADLFREAVKTFVQQTQQASMRETMAFIESERLFGIGCGIVDMMLLASTRLSPGVE